MLPRVTVAAPSLGVPAAGWAYLGQPLHAAGLALMLAAGAVLIPPLLLAAVLARHMPLSVLTTREWRRRYRHWRTATPLWWMRRDRAHQRSADIPPWVQRLVKAADRRCVARQLGGCAGAPHGRWFYEDDHCVPWIAGGITWLPNLYLTCHFHNQTKSNWNRDRRGHVHYRPSSYGGVNDRTLARRVYECERRARRNPARYVRAAWALGA